MDDLSERIRSIVGTLSEKTLTEILAFDKERWMHIGEIVNNNDIYQQLGDMNCYASDDGYEYFASWLILQGKETYDSVKANPRTLLDMIAEGEEYAPGKEEFKYAPSRAFEMKKTKKDQAAAEDIANLEKFYDYYDFAASKRKQN